MSWFAELGYQAVYGPDIAPTGNAPERDSYSDVVLEDRLRTAIMRLNPDLESETVDDVVRQVLRIDTPSLPVANRNFHLLLRDGVTVEVKRPDGSIGSKIAMLVDYDRPDNNDWLALNQYTVKEGQHERRADVVVFVNGLPVGLMELKNIGDEEATVQKAHNQLGTYKHELPKLLTYNEVLVVSDGQKARIGSLTAGLEWFKPWPTVDTEEPEQSLLELETLIRGVFDKSRLLELIHNFVLFEDDTDSDRVFKILAGYHQFHAARQAVRKTIDATADDGDRRIGVVWHTQGSGKSFTMLFYAGMVISTPEMNNPTLVVLTDRNDLDDQLFGQFQRCHEILRQAPIQANSVEHLREVLQVASGGVIFTTVHKFAEAEGRFPVLTDRTNVVVMADEAHRSQYGFTARKKTNRQTGEETIAYGFARNIRDALPNASFIGFTGTPVELDDKNTRAVFGDYISVYDIQRAVNDKATVPIYYESRIIKMALEADNIEDIDNEFDQITEGEEEATKSKIKAKWAALEAMVGHMDRISLLADDLVEHFEARCEAMMAEGVDGKGMIVCMSRRICIDLYNALIALRPDWHHDDDDKGALKIIMTGSADDGAEWQQHIRTKQRRKSLATHFKKADSEFKLVIVRDMWLTGFDAPSMHTMYIDKPMKGHGLMQAIARVNRVFKEKPGGLVVDYLGIGDSLKKALKTYTESGGQGETTIDTSAAVEALRKHHEQCVDLLHGFDWSNWNAGTSAERITLLQSGQDFILGQEDGKARWIAMVGNLSKAFSLCPTEEYAESIREDVEYFQIIRTMFRKYSESGKSPTEMDFAVRQLVAKAVMSADDSVIDVFTAAGVERPDISILSDEFLEEVRNLPYQNVAVELLRKLLHDDIKVRSKKNIVQGRSFAEMLQATLNSYHNRAISTQEIIEELIQLAKDIRAAEARGDELGLTNDEVCFYDALANHGTAIDAMTEDKLKVIATELVTKVRNNVSIDWTLRESARSKIRVLVKRILRHHGYPPDLQEAATQLVLEQASVLCMHWTA